VKISINGRDFNYIQNAINDDKYRASYFSLVERVFGLDFNPWHESGFCKGCFTPYTLFDGSTAISSVGVAINDFIWNGSKKRYAQISTVATDPDYRNLGLSRWLSETVLDEWREKCDCIYLYANDSVVDFYPKFGFTPVNEYTYNMPLVKKDGTFRKLNLSDRNDVEMLIKYYKKSNPYSLITMSKDIEMMMFHCITFLSDCIYYIEEHGAVAIAVMEDGKMFCYDVFTDANCPINDILGIITPEEIDTVTLGFTPKDKTGYIVEKANEEDTTVFVLKGMKNVFVENKITLPYLSRA